jgi:hypothetical protein
VDVYATLDEALMMGLDDEQRAEVTRQIEEVSAGKKA